MTRGSSWKPEAARRLRERGWQEYRIGMSRVDGVEQAQEVLLRVDVLLAVGAQQDVSTFLEAEARVDVAGLNLRQVLVKDLRHR